MEKEREFEIDLDEGYFIAPSPIGRNMDLSLRAKGLMYVFFTLPPEWECGWCRTGMDIPDELSRQVR